MPRHIARKRFGQHFLHDPRILHAIVDAIDPKRGDTLVEIGPGLGALTAPLLARVEHLHVIEIDRDLIAHLRETYPRDRLTVHEGDALAFDFAVLGSRLRIVGNLPYNISTPLLFHLATFADHVVDMIFMLQKEVVDRMVAAPSTADYGRLSVMLQVRFEMMRVLRVPPGAFNPPPKVESAVVRLAPKRERALDAAGEARLARIVTAAFGQRRKTLRNALRTLMSEDTLRAAGIDPGLRAENLSVADFVRLANIPMQSP